MTSLKNKIAIITGCASGIGLATTKAFLASGAIVFGIDISPFPSPSPLPEASGFTFYQANLLGFNAIDEAVAACVSQYGSKIDILANVAGVMDNYHSANTVTDAMLEKVMAINLTVPIKMMRAVLTTGGMMNNRSGSIINVASKSGFSGGAAGIAYTASKHAIIGATKNVAWRFHETHGIRCNAVCPGAIPTGIINSMDLENVDVEALAEIKPFHKLHNPDGGMPKATADDVANAIVFLASDASRSINGVVLPVDRAWSAV